MYLTKHVLQVLCLVPSYRVRPLVALRAPQLRSFAFEDTTDEAYGRRHARLERLEHQLITYVRVVL